jgi:2'-hydroxyisoflavone reductase
VTTFNRGQSADELPAAVERLRGDRDEGAAGLAALAGRRWGACVDLSGYTPRQVRPSAGMLRDAVGRYVFVSAMMVYGDPTDRPVRETLTRQPPAAEDITDICEATYGALKVTCEDIVQEIFADRCALLRPQTVAGPHDPSGRYVYWARRARLGGEMLAPGDGSDHVQVIDVRDLARFVCTVIERGLGGAYNLAGPRLTWAEFLRILGAQNLVWVPASILAAAGLTFVDLPLFRAEHGPRAGLMDVCTERARAAGLVLTSPEITAQDTLAWISDQELPLALSPERERTLLEAARRAARHSS